MAEERFLIVRLSSMGDILNALPAASSLRASFPAARISWLVGNRWRPLVELVRGIDSVLALERFSLGSLRENAKLLRREQFSCVIDFQGLYKSALLARLSGAPRRVGFAPPIVRERGAAMFYTERVASSATHVIDQYLALTEHLGARLPGRDAASLFPLRVPEEIDTHMRNSLAAAGLSDYFVLNPGGGWMSKCWPAERYGDLHQRLAKRFGWRGVVSYGPGERELAEALYRAAGQPQPLLLEMDVPQLTAVLHRAKLFVGGDTGPMHLAGALGVPVVALHGPTDPARNGPYFPQDIAIRNAGPAETTHARGSRISHTMLSISVEQVEEAVLRRLGEPR